MSLTIHFMHELSLALDVIDLVLEEAGKNSVKKVLEIEIEVGDISGVDIDAFTTALGIALKTSVPGNPAILLKRMSGTGICSGCGLEFEMHDLLSLCPACGGLPAEIISGKELKVLSIVGE